MSRLMYDSVDPNSIPTNAQMVAGYIDGSTYRWPESAWSRFPNSVKVRIARRVTTNDGHVLDVESGIPTVWPPTRAIVDWVIMRRRAGVEPTIYCNQLNDWSGIKKLFTDANVAQPLYWVARYNNVRDIPAGAVAKQFANSTLAGGPYDLSIVADYWPGVDGGDDMPLTDADLAKIRKVVWGTTHEPDGGAYEGLNFVLTDAAMQAVPGGYADHIRTALRTIIGSDVMQAQLTALVAAHADGDHDLESILQRLEAGQAKAITDAVQNLAVPALTGAFQEFVTAGNVDEQIAQAVVRAFAVRLDVPAPPPVSEV